MSDPWDAFDDLDGTAYWRRTKAEEYPDDNRNDRAASIIEHIIKTQDKVSKEVQAAYNVAIERMQANEGAGYEYSIQTGEYRRGIGFRQFPDDANEYLRDITEIIDDILGDNRINPKSAENRVRRLAKQQCLTLGKSRTRNPGASDYGKYMIWDDNNAVVAGATPNAYSLTLEEAERFLADPHRPRFRKDKDGKFRWHIPEGAA